MEGMELTPNVQRLEPTTTSHGKKTPTAKLPTARLPRGLGTSRSQALFPTECFTQQIWVPWIFSPEGLEGLKVHNMWGSDLQKMTGTGRNF